MKMPDPCRVLVFGSRHLNTLAAVGFVRGLLEGPFRATVVIHGAGDGIDTCADYAAAKLGIPTEPYPADWLTHRRAAGPIRNSQMITEGRPERGLCVHTDPNLGRGSSDMALKLWEAKVPTRVFILSGPKLDHLMGFDMDEAHAARIGEARKATGRGR